MVDLPGVPDAHSAPAVRGWAARVVAYGLPLLLVLVAWADLELWPATGWRLFSGIRQPTVPTWIVEVDRGEGGVATYDPAAAGDARRSWRHQLDRALDDRSRQLELCRQWLGEARVDDPEVRSLRIERARLDIPRDDGPSSVVSRTEVARC